MTIWTIDGVQKGSTIMQSRTRARVHSSFMQRAPSPMQRSDVSILFTERHHDACLAAFNLAIGFRQHAGVTIA
ncbi:hypothetical protein L915_15769 [Phytophthora nicotianae]|nr:hypothetical protein L915_15769 [Phytophthora nicotianae]